jgi:hypothetical protein
VPATRIRTPGPICHVMPDSAHLMSRFATLAACALEHHDGARCSARTPRMRALVPRTGSHNVSKTALNCGSHRDKAGRFSTMSPATQRIRRSSCSRVVFVILTQDVELAACYALDEPLRDLIGKPCADTAPANFNLTTSLGRMRYRVWLGGCVMNAPGWSTRDLVSEGSATYLWTVGIRACESARSTLG